MYERGSKRALFEETTTCHSAISFDVPAEVSCRLPHDSRQKLEKVRGERGEIMVIMVLFGDGITPRVTCSVECSPGEQIRGYLGGDLDNFPRIVENPCLVEDLAQLDNTMFCCV